MLKGTLSKISSDKKGVLKSCKNSKIDKNLLNKKLVSGKMVIKYTANLSVLIFTAFSHEKFSAVLELCF